MSDGAEPTAYATRESVTRQLPLLKVTLSARDPNVPDETIDEWCADISAEIDAKRALIGDTGPIDTSDAEGVGANHLRWVQMLATKGVASRVLGALQGRDEVVEQANRLALDYRMGIEAFCKARVSLMGGGGPEFGSVDADYEPVVTRTGSPW